MANTCEREGAPLGQPFAAQCCCGARASVIDIGFFGLEEDLPAGVRPFRRVALWL
jgi:hypothetical protein